MENVGIEMPFSDLGQVVGFMDLLGVHPNALTHAPPIQFPATPNSSLSEAVTGEIKKRDNKEDQEEDDGGGQKHKRNKRCKLTKSREETKIKVPKVSFITKSEILHLDDGYKWRKYGQKPVKNSPFPRNYYRCTTSWCSVKKRVERSYSDPSIVITTYEGQHTHPRPLLIMPKRSNNFQSNGLASGSHFGLPTFPPQLHQLCDYNNQQQQQLSVSRIRYLNNHENGFDDDHVVMKCQSRDLMDGAGLVHDHGLLEDVVSSHIMKE